jgi:PHD/YefM family antitoxin component YafN of YafNO toxin-antitoxin module
LAVGGETVTIVEDAIAAIKRMRDAGNFECTVVYKEFNTEKSSEDKKKASTIAEGDEEQGDEGEDTDEKQGGEGDEEDKPTKEETEEGGGDEPASLPGMDNQEGGANDGGDGGRVSPAPTPEEATSEVATKAKKKDRRASWDMTHSILTEKRGNANANMMDEEEFRLLVERVTAEEKNEVKMAVVAESVGDGDTEEGTGNKTSDVIKDQMGMKLLNSKQIIELCGCTPSVRTKLAFLEVLIPRCTDPSEGGAGIIDLFRFTGEKEIVSDALKIRASALKAGMQMVASSFATGHGGTGSTGASAAAVAIAGVTYSASSNSQNKRRGSLGGGVGGSTAKGMKLQRDSTGMISNPLLRKHGTSRGI